MCGNVSKVMENYVLLDFILGVTDEMTLTVAPIMQFHLNEHAVIK